MNNLDNIDWHKWYAAFERVNTILGEWAIDTMNRIAPALEKLRQVFWDAYVASLPSGVEPTQDGFDMWLEEQSNRFKRDNELRAFGIKPPLDVWATAMDELDVSGLDEDEQ